ncbi:hypothetical protein FRB99_000858 [Tulasnella sp. 403]|nr:hypothetical protein FRB99_000858 [Tulasnella sp. 403]
MTVYSSWMRDVEPETRIEPNPATLRTAKRAQYNIVQDGTPMADVPFPLNGQVHAWISSTSSDEIISSPEPTGSQTHASHPATNAHVPLYQLPPEIFSRVLYLVLEDETDPSRHRRRLCLVGKAWNHAIRSTPELWTFIDSKESEKQVGDGLRLSGGLPLRVRWTAWCEQPADPLIQHSRRWSELEIVNNRFQDKTTASLLAATTPKLTRLSISSMWKRSSDSVALTEDGANLRYLDLRGLSMNWDSPRLSGLISLRLSHLSSPPSISRLLDILQTSPHIHTLHLEDWEGWQDVSPVPPTLPSLTFPNLVHLRLSKIPVAYILAIVKYIQAPQCSDISLDDITDPECGLFQEYDSGFASLVRRLLFSSGEALRLDFALYDDFLQLSSGFQWMSNTLSFNVEHFDPPYCFRIISRFVAQLKLNVHLCIDASGWTRPYHPFLSAALDMLSPTVSKLSIAGEFKPLLEYLARPQEKPDETYAWPCPSLRELELTSTGRKKPLNQDIILEFLRGRWGKANVPPEAPHYSHPQKLETLSLSRFRSTPATVIQSIFDAEPGLFNFTEYSKVLSSEVCSFGFKPTEC